MQRAYELGLVNRVVPRADVLGPRAIALAARIAANAPGAVAATRRLMWVTATDGAAAGLTALRDQPRERSARARSGGRARGVLREARAAMGHAPRMRP